MTTARKPTPRKHAPARKLSHGDVMDFVTGGAATQANRRHAAHAKTAQHAPTPGARKAVPRLSRVGGAGLKVNISSDLHRKLKAEAARRRTTVDKLVEQLVARQLKD